MEKNEEKIYTRSDLNKAVTKGVEMLAVILKNKITREIVLTMISEAEQRSVNGSIELTELDKVGKAVIFEVEKNDKKRNQGKTK
jgi:hypothetical protein